MIHPSTTLGFIDPRVGWGVFATEFIPRGTVTWVQDPLDQAIDPARLRRLGPAWRRWSEHHTFADAEGRRILCWDLCRAMNHSCRPNCAGTELGYEIAIVDIHVGEQLTNDYGTLHIEAGEGFPCACAQPDCRGAVAPDSAAIERLRPAVVAALALAPGLPQPLLELLELQLDHGEVVTSMLADRSSVAEM